jgi:hypothetical protein
MLFLVIREHGFFFLFTRTVVHMTNDVRMVMCVEVFRSLYMCARSLSVLHVLEKRYASNVCTF